MTGETGTAFFPPSQVVNRRSVMVVRPDVADVDVNRQHATADLESGIDWATTRAGRARVFDFERAARDPSACAVYHVTHVSSWIFNSLAGPRNPLRIENLGGFIPAL